MHNLFEEGYIQIYTGDGKGKTTAAIGVSVRALASGLSVFFGQFMKSRLAAEHTFFEQFPAIDLHRFGTGRFTRGKPSQQDVDKALEGWSICKEAIISDKYDLIVLDELNVALFMGLLEIDPIIEILKQKPRQTEIIITGRRAPEKLIEIADLVTEMLEIKHYYTKGVPARKGIEE